MTRTVLDKLGHKVGMTAWAHNRPRALTSLAPLPDQPPHGAIDLIVGFVARSADVAPVLAAVLPHYQRGARLWLAYPKTTGAIATDITRDKGWDALEPHDLLPVSQVALDSTWSALRFRYRDEISRITRKF